MLCRLEQESNTKILKLISEILTENPNKEEPIEIDLFDEEQEELKKKDK